MEPVLGHVLSARIAQRVSELRPLSAVVVDVVENNEIFLERPITLEFGLIHMVKPLLAALLGAFEENAFALVKNPPGNLLPAAYESLPL